MVYNSLQEVGLGEMPQSSLLPLPLSFVPCKEIGLHGVEPCEPTYFGNPYISVRGYLGSHPFLIVTSSTKYSL